MAQQFDDDVNPDSEDWLLFDEDGGYASFNDTDTPAEVIAVWRIQRRIALSYMAIFLLATFAWFPLPPHENS